MKQFTRVLTLCLSLSVSAVFAQSLNLVGNLPYAQRLSDIWGAEVNGTEYALVGVNDGFSVVSLATPSTPTEVQFFPGPSTIWRDIKTWGNYAYVTNESSQGLFIVDMSGLPGSAGTMPSKYYDAGGTFSSAHNIFIDSSGYAYLFGADTGQGGALILDLATDPWNPTVAGMVDEYYFHDGMVQGDTLWASAIYAGIFVKYDISNKSTPLNLGSNATPNNFTHNAWISDDSRTLYTTDEVSNGYIGVYDVSDMNNVTELDRWQSSPGENVIPHNTHFLDDFIITSYYRDGIIVNDVTYPYNVIQTGRYDSSPLTGNGFDGSWGAYPYLPSGLILNTDIQGGLDVLSYDGGRACYLEGVVTDASNNNTINGVSIEVLGTTLVEETDLTGFYATGTPNSGTYDVVYGKVGYVNDTVSATLANGVLVTQNVALQPDVAFTLNGMVRDLNTQQPIPGAFIDMVGDNGLTYTFTADANGNFSINNIFGSNYTVSAGNWGHVTTCQYIPVNSSTPTLLLELEPGIYDDFTFDFGWTVLGNATAGIWERAVPEATFNGNDMYNPGDDVGNDCGNQAFVTGNDATGGVGGDDVDNGSTVLVSPFIDMSSMTSPTLSYYRWFANGSGSGIPNDSLVVQLSDGNVAKQVDFRRFVGSSPWTKVEVRVKDYFQTLTNNMHLIVTVSDNSPGHLVEGGLDLFRVQDSTNVSVSEQIDQNLSLFPNPSTAGFNIETTFDLRGGKVLVYSTQGKLVKTLEVNETNYYEPMVAKGLYIVQLTDANGKVVARESWMKQ